MLTFNLFWNQFGNMMKENSFEKHFDKDVSLTELLEDDSIISEMKNQNHKLIGYLKTEHFAQLVDYITILPTDIQDEKRAFRYPFYACELLCCDNSTVIDAFFPGEESVNSEEQKQNEEQKEDQDQQIVEEDEQKGQQDQQIVEEEQKEQQDVKEYEQQEVKEHQQEEQQEEKQEEKQQQLLEKQEQQVKEQQEFPQSNKLKQKVDLLQYFCQFVENHEGEMNSVLAGYFSRVFNNLYQRRTVDILNYIYTQPNLNFINRLTSYMYSKSMVDVLVKVLAFDKDLVLNSEDQFLSIRIDMIHKMIEVFSNEGSYNFEIGQNLQNAISEMINKAYMIAGCREIFDELLSFKQFYLLCCLSTDPQADVSVPASTIVSQLLIFAIIDESKKQQQREEIISLEVQADEAFEALNTHIPKIVDYLRQLKQNGQTRLKLAETLNVILRANRPHLKQTLADQDIFLCLNRILKASPLNNLFHLQYQQLVITIMEQQYQPLLDNLLDRNDLIGFLVELTTDLQPLRGQSRSATRPGYLGSITKICKALMDQASKKESMMKYVEGDQWAQLKKNFLDKSLKDSDNDLGGGLSNRDLECNEDAFEFSIIKQNNNITIQRYQGFLTNSNKQPTQDLLKEVVQETVQAFGDFNSFSWTSNDNKQAETAWDAFATKTVTQSDNTQQDNTQQDNTQLDNTQLDTDDGAHDLQFWRANIDQDVQDQAFLEFETN